jgi:hypothetical protein
MESNLKPFRTAPIAKRWADAHASGPVTVLIVMRTNNVSRWTRQYASRPYFWFNGFGNSGTSYLVPAAEAGRGAGNTDFYKL